MSDFADHADPKKYGWYSASIEKDRLFYFIYTTSNGNEVRVTCVTHSNKSPYSHRNIDDGKFVGEVVNLVRRAMVYMPIRD